MTGWGWGGLVVVVVTALRSKQTLSVGGTSRSQLSLDIIRAVTPRGGFYPINHQQLISGPPPLSVRLSTPSTPCPPNYGHFQPSIALHAPGIVGSRRGGEVADWETRLQTEAEFKSLPEPLTRAHLVKDGLCFGSVQFQVVSMRSKKPLCAPSLLLDVSLTFP